MIVLTILKVIGIILLVFLLLIFIALGVLLLAPIRYYSDSYKKEEADDYCIKFDAYWILRAFRFNAVYDPDGFKMKLKLLWMTLIDTASPDPDSSDAADDITNKSKQDSDYKSQQNSVSDYQNGYGSDYHQNSNSESQQDIDDITDPSLGNFDYEISESDTSQNDTVVLHKTDSANSVDDNSVSDESVPSEHIDESSQTPPGTDSDHTINEDVSRFDSKSEPSSSDIKADRIRSFGQTKTFFDKIKAKYTVVLDRILHTVKKLCRLKEQLTKEENIIAFRLLIKNSKYLLKHYRFRALKGHFTYGSDDPYTVGQVMSYLSIFYSVFGNQFTIDPVFDRKIITGSIYLKGHIRLIHLVLSIIDLMRNKTIRQKVMNHFKEDTNG